MRTAIAAEFSRLTLSEAARLIAKRDASPVELTTAALEQCGRLEDDVNAFITLLPEAALASAKQAERELSAGRRRGPLHGIPVAVKDLFWTKRIRTTAGSKILRDFMPDADAAVVQRLRRAGAVLLGKTNLVEFAFSPSNQYHPEYGPTKNPWDLRRFPGASSNGSAAAVSAGMAMAAIGSDTAGSVRTPASFCGLTGLKPTYGLVSLFGAIPLAPTMDHIGLLTRTAEDCGLLMEAVAGFDARDPRSVRRRHRRRTNAELAPRQLRVGVLGDFFVDGAQVDVVAAFANAVATIEQTGADIRPISLPDLEEDVSIATTILKVEAAATHLDHIRQHAALLVPDVRRNLEEGLTLSGVAYVKALAARSRVQRTVQSALDGVDILLSPTCDTTAPMMADDGRLLEVAPYLAAGRPSARVPFNFAGVPAISVPCGMDVDGMPIGLQIIGGAGQDQLLIEFAAQYQSATAWHMRQPLMASGPSQHVLSESATHESRKSTVIH